MCKNVVSNKQINTQISMQTNEEIWAHRLIKSASQSIKIDNSTKNSNNNKKAKRKSTTIYINYYYYYYVLNWFCMKEKRKRTKTCYTCKTTQILAPTLLLELNFLFFKNICYLVKKNTQLQRRRKLKKKIFKMNMNIGK